MRWGWDRHRNRQTHTPLTGSPDHHPPPARPRLGAGRATAEAASVAMGNAVTR